ncbi:MAG: hypothetical protein AAF127_06910 [Pseudomonadota bacterium]
MSFLSPLTCAMGRHRPSRDSYRWDQDAYAHVGVCRHCGKPIKRLSHRKWELRKEPAHSEAEHSVEPT